MQVKCWQIRRQTKAPQAAGAIHTDFERGFICAEVITCLQSYNIYLNLLSVDFEEDDENLYVLMLL